jgi:hypothetical protein
MPRPKSAQGQTVPGCRAPRIGSKVVKLAQRAGDIPLDHIEALELISPLHWAYAFRGVLVYMGVSRNLHCYELLPADEAAVLKRAAKAATR